MSDFSKSQSLPPIQEQPSQRSFNPFDDDDDDESELTSLGQQLFGGQASDSGAVDPFAVSSPVASFHGAFFDDVPFGEPPATQTPVLLSDPVAAPNTSAPARAKAPFIKTKIKSVQSIDEGSALPPARVSVEMSTSSVASGLAVAEDFLSALEGAPPPRPPKPAPKTVAEPEEIFL
jgi:hypothetical protein